MAGLVIDWSKIEALAAETDDCTPDENACSLCVAIRAARETVKLKPQLTEKPKPVCSHPRAYQEGSLGWFCSVCSQPVDESRYS